MSLQADMCINLKKLKVVLKKTAQLLFYRCVKEYSVQPSFKLSEGTKSIPTFVDMVNARRKQASKSVLVQVQSTNSFTKLYELLLTFGEISYINNFIRTPSNMSFSLVEFQNINSLSTLFSKNNQLDFDIIGTSCTSPFLSCNLKSEKKEKDNVALYDYGMFPNDQDIVNHLLKTENSSEQILKLYKLTTLNDLGVRLRFLTAYQTELAFSALFPGSQCLPFGSSVNGCGRLNSDLDLVFNMNRKAIDIFNNASLSYQFKSNLRSDRLRLQKHLDVLADVIQNLLPGCSNVVRILQAQVPIIKYKQNYTGLDCDLSLTNNNAITMTKLLYTLNHFDCRVKPFLLVIKHWAEKCNITNSFPGRWISNFSLSLLTLFYLQQIKVIPTIDEIFKFNKINCEHYDNEVLCTILHDKLIQFSTHKDTQISLFDMLFGFMEYYMKFDFSINGISLNSGQVIRKENINGAMFIINPLDQELNVSKNVSFEEIENLKIKLTETFGILATAPNIKNDSEEWGIIPLIKTSTLQKKKFDLNTFHPKRKTRLLNVGDLFKDLM
uniref:Poly(A) RNA polymerase mitochondrial-like central palm domain-containing protein n=1 Tax=Clastoptera arizonana TaxID=38151 RepID=A0A1B6DJ98_9HEMI